MGELAEHRAEHREVLMEVVAAPLLKGRCMWSLPTAAGKASSVLEVLAGAVAVTLPNSLALSFPGQELYVPGPSFLKKQCLFLPVLLGAS